MKILLIIGALLFAASALAQQASPSEQALGQKLMQEIQGGLSCNTTLLAVQADLAKAQARIKELEEKAK